MCLIASGCPQCSHFFSSLLFSSLLFSSLLFSSLLSSLFLSFSLSLFLSQIAGVSSQHERISHVTVCLQQDEERVRESKLTILLKLSVFLSLLFVCLWPALPLLSGRWSSLSSQSEESFSTFLSSHRRRNSREKRERERVCVCVCV